MYTIYCKLPRRFSTIENVRLIKGDAEYYPQLHKAEDMASTPVHSGIGVTATTIVSSGKESDFLRSTSASLQKLGPAAAGPDRPQAIFHHMRAACSLGIDIINIAHNNK
jgi:hypothetical protein